ncbi:MAG: nucleotide exchange factor GrpE [Clostridia bacterium]|nr:nucleotide exchange factor GrpE [Clostridia bacterium]
MGKETLNDNALHDEDINPFETQMEDESSEDNTQKENIQQDDHEKLLQENCELNEKYMRLAADFQNFKRRTESEKKEVFSYANEKIMMDLLCVLDNFERAIGSIDDSKEQNLSDGIRMIFKQFNEVLEKFGLKEIETEDLQFNPNYHHAVMKEPVENKESNIITETLQKGYLLNGKVIRPSMVKVSE